MKTEELLIGHGILSMESQLKLRLQVTVPLTDLNLKVFLATIFSVRTILKEMYRRNFN